MSLLPILPALRPKSFVPRLNSRSLYQLFLIGVLCGLATLSAGCIPTVENGHVIVFSPQETSFQAQSLKLQKPGVLAPQVATDARAFTDDARNKLIQDLHAGYFGKTEGDPSSYLLQKRTAQARLEKRSDDYGKYQLGLSGAGIISGITAAGLLAASPANAATAAICTAFTTGTLAFQTNSVNQGFSRTASDRARVAFDDRLKTAEADFIAKYGALQAIPLNSSDDAAWNSAAGATVSAFMALEAAVVNDPPLIPEDADVARLKQQIEDMKQVAGIQLPKAPSDLTAKIQAGPPVSVALTWKNSSTNATTTKIQRSTDNKNWTTLDTLAGDSVTYLDKSATAGTAYYYQVSCVNSSGESPSATTSPITP